jgi:hypothetical protein
MLERVLKELRSLIRKRQYIITIHALEEMGEDDVLAEDVEHAILTGKIIERPENENIYLLERTVLENLYTLS